MTNAGKQKISQRDIVVLDEIDSTNSEALRRGRAGDRGPLWIVARRQLSGRGRSGRQWTSMTGNLHASHLLELSCCPQIASQLALLAGVAVYDTVVELSSRRPVAPASKLACRQQPSFKLDQMRLKWPNDLLIGRAKCAGILCESACSAHNSGAGSNLSINIGQKLLSVTGIGINLRHAPTEATRLVTCLRDHGIAAEPAETLDILANKFAHWQQVWQEGQGFAAIRQAWLECAGPLFEPISIKTGVGTGTAHDAGPGAGVVYGDFAGIDNDGALLMVMPGGKTQRFTFGDVSLHGQ